MPTSGFLKKFFDVPSHNTPKRHVRPKKTSAITQQKLNPEYAANILEMAKLLSNNDSEVIERVQMCSSQNIKTYLHKYKDLLITRRCLEQRTPNRYALCVSRNTLLWLALVDSLIDTNYASHTAWSASYTDILFNLRAVLAKHQLTYPEDIYCEEATLENENTQFKITDALKVIQLYLREPYTVGILDAMPDECDFIIAPQDTMRQAQDIATSIRKKIITCFN